MPTLVLVLVRAGGVSESTSRVDVSAACLAERAGIRLSYIGNKIHGRYIHTYTVIVEEMDSDETGPEENVRGGLTGGTYPRPKGDLSRPASAQPLAAMDDVSAPSFSRDDAECKRGEKEAWKYDVPQPRRRPLFHSESGGGREGVGTHDPRLGVSIWCVAICGVVAAVLVF